MPPAMGSSPAQAYWVTRPHGVIAGNTRNEWLAAGELHRAKRISATERSLNHLSLNGAFAVRNQLLSTDAQMRRLCWQRLRRHREGAQRRVNHPVVTVGASGGGHKNAVTNKLGHKARQRLVINRLGGCPLHQSAALHDAHGVRDGEGFALIMRHKEGRGASALQDGTHFFGELLASINV